MGGVYEVDKNSGGTVTGTKTYYPAAGAMRAGSTLYYVLKDHLGSASVVAHKSGVIQGEDRFSRSGAGYPFGETRFTTGTMYTDKLFTGQREMAGLGIYHYGARFYSPKLGRFLSADTIVPGYANPQNLNRFSYVRNNPLRYIDPTGHWVDEGCGTGGPGGGTGCNLPPPGGGGGGGRGGDDRRPPRGGDPLPAPIPNPGGGSDDCDDGDVCVSVTTEDIICDYILDNCPAASTDLALIGTALDGISFAINAPFGAAAAASVSAALLGDPAGWLAYGTVVNAYRFAAPVSTVFGWAGFGAWALQGLVTGENQFGMSMRMASDGSLTELTVSGSLAQDTLFSALNDTLALRLREPIVATIWSGAGIGYDLIRNPWDPSSPVLPTIIQPNGSISYNFQTASFSLDGSWFPP